MVSINLPSVKSRVAVLKYRKFAVFATEATEEFVILADDLLVNLDLTIVAQLESEVEVVRVVVPAASYVSTMP